MCVRYTYIYIHIYIYTHIHTCTTVDTKICAHAHVLGVTKPGSVLGREAVAALIDHRTADDHLMDFMALI